MTELETTRMELCLARLDLTWVKQVLEGYDSDYLTLNNPEDQAKETLERAYSSGDRVRWGYFLGWWDKGVPYLRFELSCEADGEVVYLPT